MTNRIYQNGWALGPSIEFLGWPPDLPTAQVGALPRYAVLRWALGEDADFWLPLQGKLSRSQPCLWCQNNTRCFPQGPGYGALCPSCFQPAAARDITLHNLNEESHAFLQFHKIEMPPLTRLPPAFSRLAALEGCRAPDSYASCVLCQRGINSIDHWLSFCQVARLFLHEYGRRVGMVPRSSLKEGKNRQMVEKGTKAPNQPKTKNPSPQAETPPSCSLPSTLGETCETELVAISGPEFAKKRTAAQAVFMESRLGGFKRTFLTKCW